MILDETKKVAEVTYLLGFMGAGKSTVGRLLAKAMEACHFDLDQILEEQEGISLGQLIALKGEPYFRERESELLRQLTEKSHAQHLKAVISLGGGTLLSELNRNYINGKGQRVYLKANVETLAKRTLAQGNFRPLLPQESFQKRCDRISGLLVARQAGYESADLSVVTDDLSDEEVSSRIRHFLGFVRSRLQFHFPSGVTEVYVGEQLFSDPQPLLGVGASWLVRRPSKKGFLFCDENLLEQSKKVILSLQSLGWTIQLFICPPGEKLKNFQELYPWYGKLLEAGADRHSTLFALGGGAIGDAIGFLAGTFMRGIPWVGIPTTLLAQVDSCLGGKTGVNHEAGKNLVGIFHQPSVVLCDLEFLKALPEREMISGLGEVFKYGLIFDREFFNHLLSQWKKVLTHDSVLLKDLILRCLSWKASLIARDERDLRGEREVLNLGHTVGHALEVEAGYGQLRHGEAVILGMRVAAELSVLQGHLSKEESAMIQEGLARLPITLPQGFNLEQRSQRLLQRIRNDKKAREGRVRFVLLQEVGKTVLDSTVSETQILKALESVL